MVNYQKTGSLIEKEDINNFQKDNVQSKNQSETVVNVDENNKSQSEEIEMQAYQAQLPYGTLGSSK